jgi:hypothetical protein
MGERPRQRVLDQLEGRRQGDKRKEKILRGVWMAAKEKTLQLHHLV